MTKQSAELLCPTTPKVMRGQLSYDDYKIAIICPLEVDISAMRYMLDEEHEPLPNRPNDPIDYVFGQLKGNNTVIASLPDGSQSVSDAAFVGTHMRRSFPKSTHRLLVGIASGIPNSHADIRLGDVVVSMPRGVHGGIYQYDITEDGSELRGFLLPPPRKWRSAVVMLQSDHRARPNRITEFITDMMQERPSLIDAYRRPSPENDILFLPDNHHIQSVESYDRPSKKLCQDCDQERVVDRAERTTEGPVIHYGLIASGNCVVEDPKTRDQIGKDAGGALCIDTEALGLINDFQCVVIRGIVDYADTHKNDMWRHYGAAVAAAFAKELLVHMLGDSEAGKSCSDKHG